MTAPTRLSAGNCANSSRYLPKPNSVKPAAAEAAGAAERSSVNPKEASSTLQIAALRVGSCTFALFSFTPRGSLGAPHIAKRLYSLRKVRAILA